MPTGLSPEDRLCLLLARAGRDPATDAQTFELLKGPINWNHLWHRAEEHQVIPLLYRSLHVLNFPNVPGEFRARLTAQFRLNAVRNMLFAEELTRVVRILNDNAISSMPLKGTLLAEEIYGDPAYRSCSDIDIMVEPANAIRARRLLIENGYKSPFSDRFFEKFQLRTSADCPLTTDRGDLSYFLELHWSILQHSSKDGEASLDIWSDAKPDDHLGVRVFRLSPEWEFLYLSCHAATHKWQTLKWIADINDFCATKRIDWGLVSEKANRFDLNFIVNSTLAVCSSLYGLPLPTEFSSASLPDGVALFPDSLAASEAWKAPLYNPRLFKRPLEKFHWFVEMIFIARQADQMAFHLPDSLDFLYFVLRPLRLTFKYARHVIRVIAGRLLREGEKDREAAG